MAIAQVGSSVNINVTSTANTGTASSSITVPANTELVVVGISGYQGTAAGFEALTFTKGGVDTSMVRARLGINYNTVGGGQSGDNSSVWQAALFYLALPDIGSSKTLKWDWIGSGTSGDSDLLFSITFWSGIDTTDPVRDVKGWQKGSFPVTLPAPLICQTGDLMLAWFGGYTGGSEGSINSWSGVSTLENITHNADSDGAWATGTSSTPVAIEATSATAFTQGTLCCITLKQASGSATPEQVGPILSYAVSNNANTGTVSSLIYVPAVATLVVVGVSAGQGTANGLAAMTFTKSGTDTAMTRVAGGDANGAEQQAAIFYLNAPDTGHAKSLKWDWVGSGNSSISSMLITVTFWRNVDTSTPVRDSDGIQGSGLPLTTPTLTAQSGDRIIAWAGFAVTTGLGSVSAWSNLTAIENMFQTTADIDGAWATGSPSGNTTVGVTTLANFGTGGLCAVVLVPNVLTVSVNLTGNSMAASVGTAVARIPKSVSVTGFSMSMTIGYERIAIDGVLTLDDVPREVGNPGLFSMARFMGN